ncbi:hypothetical protein HBP99_05755 [Listeria booriae]|uniref:hypothetical protein n=1 Tax=Listeria booriae TaxID=1552123 RepID=UPI001623D9BE|nr:hypothetical protein [Listeria booriae]MBC2368130.1 hypothetical protein [Listeria booriae]
MKGNIVVFEDNVFHGRLTAQDFSKKLSEVTKDLADISMVLVVLINGEIAKFGSIIAYIDYGNAYMSNEVMDVTSIVGKNGSTAHLEGETEAEAELNNWNNAILHANTRHQLNAHKEPPENVKMHLLSLEYGDEVRAKSRVKGVYKGTSENVYLNKNTRYQVQHVGISNNTLYLGSSKHDRLIKVRGSAVTKIVKVEK